MHRGRTGVSRGLKQAEASASLRTKNDSGRETRAPNARLFACPREPPAEQGEGRPERWPQHQARAKPRRASTIRTAPDTHLETGVQKDRGLATCAQRKDDRGVTHIHICSLVEVGHCASHRGTVARTAVSTLALPGAP